MAWTSFDKNAIQIDYRYYGNLQGNTSAEKKIHPTQKPFQLYERVLMKFANKGDKILDTHLGSGSIAIACHNLGFDLEGYELDKEYFEAAKKRLQQHQSQIRMF
jgi:site-specific DNA-methyltransferase (adenine-specific)